MKNPVILSLTQVFFISSTKSDPYLLFVKESDWSWLSEVRSIQMLLLISMSSELSLSSATQQKSAATSFLNFLDSSCSDNSDTSIKYNANGGTNMMDQIQTDKDTMDTNTIQSGVNYIYLYYSLGS